jgi:hypothetical protein
MPAEGLLEVDRRQLGIFNTGEMRALKCIGFLEFERRSSDSVACCRRHCLVQCWKRLLLGSSSAGY